MRTAAIMLLFALSLQGCGHKGPLFMPPPEQPSAQTPSQPSPASQPSPVTQP